MFPLIMHVAVKKIQCFTSALDGGGGRGAVTTQMIREKAAYNLEYVISQHLNLITETHAHNFE